MVGAFAALTAERSGAWKIGESALFAGAAGALSLAGAFLATFFTAAFLAAGDWATGDWAAGESVTDTGDAREAEGAPLARLATRRTGFLGLLSEDSSMVLILNYFRERSALVRAPRSKVSGTAL